MRIKNLFSVWRCEILTLLVCLPTFCSLAADLQLVPALDASNSAPSSANGDSCLPILSADGRFVLFESTANNLVPTNSGGPVPSLLLHTFNVFRRDRVAGTNLLVSVNLASNGANWNSVPIELSTNGECALFESEASDLVLGDANNANDVFVRDMRHGTTTLVSINTNGLSGNRASRSSAMTPDGRFVAFVSEATDLVAEDTNGIADVFVRDIQAGTTTLVSEGARTTGSFTLRSSSESPVITPDGRFVAFYSTATNLVSGVRLAGEVYLRDVSAGMTTWVSTNARSLVQSVLGTTNTISCSHAISADGRFVAFVACINSTFSSSSRGIVIRYNALTAVTEIVHTNANVPTTAAFGDLSLLNMTPDGRFIALVANASGTSGNTLIYLWDAETGTNTLISADQTTGLPVVGVCDAPFVSPTGQYVAFFCSATNLATNALVSLIPPFRIYGPHLYVRDTRTNTTRLVDADTNGVGVGFGRDSTLSTYSMSADGRFVVFDLPSQNLVPNDGNGDNDVFARDLMTEATELISAHDVAVASPTPNRFTKLFPASVSTNAQFIAFASDADNLVANDTNRTTDVFVRDCLAGINILVSVGTNGVGSAGYSSEASITGDGRFVVFSSYAANLVPRDTNGLQDVFLRDLQAGTNALVSVSTNGGSGNGYSYSPRISLDGRFVLFRSQARNLAAGAYGPFNENLFLRDLQLRTNYALTTGYVATASMTLDGRFVAFLGALSTGGFINLYVWDSLAAKRIYTNSAASLIDVTISPDGRWLAYVTSTALNAFDLVGKSNISISTGSTDVSAVRPGMQFSADDRLLVFVTRRKVVAQDLNGIYDVYLHDFQTGTNLLVSRSYDSTNAANGASGAAVLSPDGRFVAYRSFATDLISNDGNNASDMFLYDLVNGSTRLVSLNQAENSTANSFSQMPMFSGDGKNLIFKSFASNLPDQGVNEYGAIYALNLSSPILTDLDGDYMDDQWETNHFSTLARDGSGDFDGDGATDLFEFLTGTDPINPASVFRAEITGGQNPVLTWPLAPGKSYRVQFKNDLSEADWVDLNGNVTLVGTQGRVSDLAPASGQKFYRIVLNN